MKSKRKPKHSLNKCLNRYVERSLMDYEFKNIDYYQFFEYLYSDIINNTMEFELYASYFREMSIFINSVNRVKYFNVSFL